MGHEGNVNDKSTVEEHQTNKTTHRYNASNLSPLIISPQTLETILAYRTASGDIPFASKPSPAALLSVVFRRGSLDCATNHHKPHDGSIVAAKLRKTGTRNSIPSWHISNQTANYHTHSILFCDYPSGELSSFAVSAELCTMDKPEIRTRKASRVSQKKPLGSIPTNSSSTSGSNRRERQSTRGGKNTSTAADLNSKIISLGNKEKWRKILGVFEKEKVSFRNVNYSTVMVQLSKNALLGET